MGCCSSKKHKRKPYSSLLHQQEQNSIIRRPRASSLRNNPSNKPPQKFHNPKRHEGIGTKNGGLHGKGGNEGGDLTPPDILGNNHGGGGISDYKFLNSISNACTPPAAEYGENEYTPPAADYGLNDSSLVADYGGGGRGHNYGGGGGGHDYGGGGGGGGYDYGGEGGGD